jgi:hypothetical protein
MARTFEPEVLKVCPEQQEIPLDEMDLDPRFRLIMREIEHIDNDSGLWSVSSSKPTPQVVPNTQAKEGRSLSGYAPSPSGRWLVLYFVDEGETERSIWLSSLDGQEQQKLLVLDLGKRPDFVTDDEMIVVDVPLEKQLTGERRWYDFVPLVRINPFTGVAKELPALPDGAIYDFYFINKNHRYAVYHLHDKPSEGYFLYNYTESSSTPVFQWLQKIEGWHYLEPGVSQRGNGLFAVMVDRSYGFDMAVDLSFDQIFRQATYEEIMQAIFLPGGDSVDITTLTYEDATKTSFPVIRTGADIYEPQTLYMFDYQEMILKDYCLNVIASGSMSISPDERFLATTLYYVSDQVSGAGIRDFVPKEAIILDTKTGHYARFDGFESGGWGIVEGEGFP